MSSLSVRKSTSPRYAFFLGLAVSAALSLTTPQALAKKDLFNSDPGTSQAVPAQEMITNSSETENEEPAISPTEAALRAQRHTDGKVMNVRQFKEENKTLYGVKLLQKNGRMKTINVDADNGNIVE